MPVRMNATRHIGCGSLVTLVGAVLASGWSSSAHLHAEPFEAIGAPPSVLAPANVSGRSLGGARVLGDRVVEADAAAGGAWAADDGGQAGAGEVVGDSFVPCFDANGCGPGCVGCSQCSDGGCCADGFCDPPGLLQYFQKWHDKGNACWVGRVDALIGWRNAPPDRPLVETGLNTLPVVNANGMDSPAAGGPRVSVFRFNKCNGTGWETTYLQLANWRSQRPLAAQSQKYALAPPGFYGNSNTQNFDTGNANLGSRLQSLEVNRHWCHGDHVRFLAGFRWIEWQEYFSLTDTFNGQQVITDYYNTGCTNSLYGGQIGLDAILLTLPWMRFDSVIKAGAYYNNGVQSSLYQSNSTGSLISQAVTINQSPLSCAFVGEVGFTGVVPVTDWLDVRIGYFGLWLSGIAQPTQQLSGQVLTQPAGGTDPTSGTINANGGVLVQAVTLGLEGRW